MLPFFLGGVAIAATGYKIKQFLSNEDNLDKINDTLMKGVDWLDSVDQKTEKFFDGLIRKIDESKHEEDLIVLLDELDDIKSTTAKIIYNDIEKLLLYATKNETSAIYEPCNIELVRNQNTSSLQYSEENYHQIERFCDILTTANNFLTQQLDELKTSSMQNESSLNLTLSHKQIKKLYKLQSSIENVIYCPISIDNVTISKVAKRSFNRIKHTIEVFKN